MALAKTRKRFRNKGKPNEKFMGWVADYMDQHGKRHTVLFKFERDAKAHLAKVVPEVNAGTHTPEHQSITVAAAGEIWIENRRNVEKLETATIRQYQNHLKHHIVPLIGRVTLAKLTAPKVSDFRDEMLKTRSRVMAGKVLTSLKSILALAQEKGLVAKNVASGIRLGQKNKRENGKLEIGRDIPSKDEIRVILSAAEGTRWHPLLATAALAGLRSSELRGLRWGDVEKDAIHVRQRMDENNEPGPPKSEAGDREIPVSPLLGNILQRWRLACPSGELVFPNGIGNVESHANIANRGFYALQIEMGIVKPATGKEGKPITEPALDEHGSPFIGADGEPEMRQVVRPKYGLHALRHFFASLMIEQNHLPKRVQAMMGHSSLQMTYDRYGHLFEASADDRAKMEKAAEFLYATKIA